MAQFCFYVLFGCNMHIQLKCVELETSRPKSPPRFWHLVYMSLRDKHLNARNVISSDCQVYLILRGVACVDVQIPYPQCLASYHSSCYYYMQCRYIPQMYDIIYIYIHIHWIYCSRCHPLVSKGIYWRVTHRNMLKHGLQSPFAPCNAPAAIHYVTVVGLQTPWTTFQDHKPHWKFEYVTWLMFKNHSLPASINFNLLLLLNCSMCSGEPPFFVPFFSGSGTSCRWYCPASDDGVHGDSSERPSRGQKVGLNHKKSWDFTNRKRENILRLYPQHGKHIMKTWDLT